jgi:hypothetical protein
MFHTLHFNTNLEPTTPTPTPTTPTTPTTTTPTIAPPKTPKKRYLYKQLNDILINFQLLQKNILSIKRLNGSNIPTFNNIRISRFLSDIIDNLIKSSYTTKEQYDQLKENEKLLYNRIINLSNIQKITYSNILYIVEDLKKQLLNNETIINNVYISQQNIKQEEQIKNNNQCIEAINNITKITNILNELKFITHKDKINYISQFNINLETIKQYRLVDGYESDSMKLEDFLKQGA